MKNVLLKSRLIMNFLEREADMSEDADAQEVVGIKFIPLKTFVMKNLCYEKPLNKEENMLKFNLDNDILEVIEESFIRNQFIGSHWYYDIQKWLKSSNGKQNEKPFRQMSESNIWWVKRYYLPKVGIVFFDIDYNMSYMEYLNSKNKDNKQIDTFISYSNSTDTIPTIGGNIPWKKDMR